MALICLYILLLFQRRFIVRIFLLNEFILKYNVALSEIMQKKKLTLTNIKKETEFLHLWVERA